MKRSIFLIFALFPFFAFAQVANPQLPGPFGRGFTNVTFSDTTLADTVVSARIYYPGSSDGQDVSLIGGLYPVIAFGHGFNLFYDDYENLCFHLATWGYIVISPNVQNGFVVDHEEFARELAASIRYMQQLGSTNGSVFQGSVGFTTGVFGHSMGGGAAGLLPVLDPGIDAVIGLAAAETNPSAIAALGSYSGPYMVISASDDNVADETGNQIPMYNAAQGQKLWVSLTGGAHCKFTDANTACDFVANPGSISRSRQQALSNRYTTAFFNFHLKGDTNYRAFMCGDSIQADDANNVLTFQTNIPGCAPVVAISQPEPAPSFTVFPNPSSGTAKITGVKAVELWDLIGRNIGKYENAQNEILIHDLQAGVYLLRDPDSGQSQKLIVRK